jgi:hypothetical protein
MFFAGLFALTSWWWTYLANLFVAVPLLGVSWVFWRTGKTLDPRSARYRFVVYVWALGAAASLVVLLALLASN